MAENVNGQDLFGSGGHQWKWSEQERFAKRLVTAGCQGEGLMLVALAGMSGVIEGRNDGEPAVLKASAASKAAADAAMNALEAPIRALRSTAAVVAYEDDTGAGGNNLILEDYVRVGGRRYGRQGANWRVWQHYRCIVRLI